MPLFKKLSDSTKWSYAGLKYAYKQELSFRLEISLAAVLTPAAFYLAADLNQLLWLLASVYLVLVVELLNTAVEATVNRIGTEKNQLSMHAKDAGSAAVFVVILMMIGVWLLVLLSNKFYPF